MKNPDKYIRKAYLAIIQSIGLKGYDKRIPSDKATPTTYVILSTQTKEEANITKCGKEWFCSILLDIVSKQPKGVVNSSIVDDIEEQIDNLVNIRKGIVVDGFTVTETKLESSASDEIETDSEYISRKLLRYRHTVAVK